MSADLERKVREAALDHGEWLEADHDETNYDAYVAGYLAAATLREKEIATLRARVAELEMVVANYLPVCIGDCGCEGSLAGCAILGDDPEASAIAESVAAKMVPPPETKP